MFSSECNVNTGLKTPPPPPAPEGQKVQKIFNRFWSDQSPPNKETSRPEDNWTTIPYYSTRKLLWLANSKMGVFNWGGVVAYPYYLGGKLGRIQKTWFLAKRGCLIGGDINPVLTLVMSSYFLTWTPKVLRIYTVFGYSQVCDTYSPLPALKGWKESIKRGCQRVGIDTQNRRATA